jgi:hypothetical protein
MRAPVFGTPLAVECPAGSEQEVALLGAGLTGTRSHA